MSTNFPEGLRIFFLEFSRFLMYDYSKTYPEDCNYCTVKHVSKTSKTLLQLDGWAGRWCWVASSVGASCYFAYSRQGPVVLAAGAGRVG